MNQWKKTALGTFIFIVGVVMSTQAIAANRALPVRTFPQYQSQWCWAAVSKTIKNYNINVLTNECTMASALIAKSNDPTLCCGTDDIYEGQPFPYNSSLDKSCNQPFTLQTAMRWNDILGRYFYRPLFFARISNEIDKNLPVGIRIQWNNNNGHFLMIYGYDRPNFSTAPMYLVFDPDRGGSSKWIAEDGVKNYKNSSRWTHTYTSIRD